MTTKALFQKEFRECWKIGAWTAGIMLVYCMVQLRESGMRQAYWHYSESGWEGMKYNFGIESSISEDVILGLLFPIVIMGVILAIRQFLVPFYTGEWGFLLHRPVTRSRVLSVKLGVAALLTFPLILIWLACWLTVQVPGWFPTPTPARIFVNGLIMQLWGVVAYCAVADGVLLHHCKPRHGIRWAAPILGLFLFMNGIICTVLSAAAFQGLFLVLCLAALCGTFLKREF